MITQVIAIRVLSSKLGADSYSIIIILTSLIGWYLLSDFGVSYSIQNFVAEHKDNNLYQYQYGLSGLKLSFLTSCVVAIALFLLITPITSFLFSPNNTYPYERGVLENCVLLSGLLFICQALGWVAWRFWYGQHNGWVANILMALGPMLGLLLIITYKTIDITTTAILFWGPPAVVGLSSYLFVFYKCYKVKSIKNLENINALVLNRAAQFFLLNFTVAFVLRTDYIVISKLGLSAESVIIYTVIMKVMNVAFSFFLSALQSIAPLCTSYYYQKNYKEIKKILRVYILIGMSGVLVFCFMLLYVKNIISDVLVPDINITIGNDVIFYAMLLFLVRGWVDPHASITNAISKLDLYKFIVPLQAFLVVIGMYLLGQKFGIVGVIVGQIIAYLLSVGLVLPWHLNKVFREV